MKKYISYVSVFLVIFFSVPLLTSVFHETVVAAMAKVTTTAKAPVPTPTVAPSRVEYSLPYPGILPDNPLYVLKTFRDKIIELLVSDPINKAEFYILQADKKLNMSIALTGKGKSAEAQEMMAQALIARTQAVTLLETTAQSGRVIPDFVLEKLTLSLKKHQEVLADMKQNVDAVATLLAKAEKLIPQSK